MSRTMAMHVRYNRPFPSSLVPLFQSESKCETILKKMTFICMKKKLRAELIFIWKVSHFNSVSKRGTRELWKGLFLVHFFAVLCKTTTWNNQSLCPVNHDGYFSNFHRELNDLKVSRDSWKKFKFTFLIDVVLSSLLSQAASPQRFKPVFCCQNASSEI